MCMSSDPFGLLIQECKRHNFHDQIVSIFRYPSKEKVIGSSRHNIVPVIHFQLTEWGKHQCPSQNRTGEFLTSGSSATLTIQATVYTYYGRYEASVMDNVSDILQNFPNWTSCADFADSTICTSGVWLHSSIASQPAYSHSHHNTGNDLPASLQVSATTSWLYLHSVQL